MKVISILSQKGGSGKTTLAIHLAVEAERRGHSAAIVDLDPQASASEWGDSRKEDAPVVVSAQSNRLSPVLEAAQQSGAEWVFIDTPPHSEQGALQAARVSDFVLIPCRAAILDLRAIGSTVNLLKIAGTSGAVVLNCVPPRGDLAKDGEAAVGSYGIDVCSLQIVQRVAFQYALTEGLSAQEYEPDGKAAFEVQQLFKWLESQTTAKEAAA